ncbi:hypothetical protein TcarDRAFT_1993 [Thermosinus carboxydivorans Nor1]|uniref:DUF3800 domain-containing protein n=2 Tax=Thermosinus TaxID=261684 RepID=A1HMN1_9FIRM|nr:hypothetical protein TcarDRAFT_1993 [Thermosinus carboxydivorans Nor1]
MLKQDANAYGMVITDEGNEIHLRKIQRRLRQYNPTSSKFGEWYNNRLDRIIEDPFERQSHHSFLIQAADMIVHALYRQENPKGSYKKFNADRLFLHIKPMTIKEAAADDPLQMGIKRI